MVNGSFIFSYRKIYYNNLNFIQIGCGVFLIYLFYSKFIFYCKFISTSSFFFFIASSFNKKGDYLHINEKAILLVRFFHKYNSPVI